MMQIIDTSRRPAGPADKILSNSVRVRAPQNRPLRQTAFQPATLPENTARNQTFAGHFPGPPGLLSRNSGPSPLPLDLFPPPAYSPLPSPVMLSRGGFDGLVLVRGFRFSNHL